MINQGRYTFESYAHVLNADRSILKLNPAMKKLGYEFLWVDASGFEENFSEIVNIPKSNDRPLTIMIGREHHGISHELHNALVHTPPFGSMFMHMEYPGILLLRKLTDFEVMGDHMDFITEQREFIAFQSSANDLILQLRLFKIGEIRFSQLFQNLVGNALKFVAPARVPEIHVGCHREGADWHFFVRDNGIGIAVRDFDRVFLLFQRLHSRQEYPGTGIGLSLCQKIVESHGGRIWIESEEGKGTTIHFTVPDRETARH